MQIPPINGNVNIPDAGAADRTQLPDLPCSEVYLFAPAGNVSAIYVGGGTVTNASGTNVGYALAAGATMPQPIKVENANHLFVATDNANDDVVYFAI